MKKSIITLLFVIVWTGIANAAVKRGPFPNSVDCEGQATLNACVAGLTTTHAVIISQPLTFTTATFSNVLTLYFQPGGYLDCGTQIATINSTIVAPPRQQIFADTCDSGEILFGATGIRTIEQKWFGATDAAAKASAALGAFNGDIVVENIPQSIAAGTTVSSNCSGETAALGSICIQTGTTPTGTYVCGGASGCAAADWEARPSVDLDQQDARDVFGLGRTIILPGTGASNGINICVDGNADNACDNALDEGWLFSVDAALGPQIEALQDADARFNAPSGFGIKFRLAGSEIASFDATTSKLTYSNAGRPLKSAEVQGREFGACTFAEAALSASRPKTGYFTCTDIDTDGFDFDFRPAPWDAGTVQVRLTAVSVAASPSGNLVLHCSGQSVGSGETITDRATTGEQSVTLTFATQYRDQAATSAAITVQGSRAAGERLYMHCDIDATGTTTAMADIRILVTPVVFYTVTGESE